MVACEEVCRDLSGRGITVLLSASFAAEQHGVSESEKHTVVGFARSLLSVNGLPKPMWAQASEIAVCAQSYGKTSSYREISNRHVEWPCDEECGSSTRVWHRVLCTHPKQFSEEIRQKCVFDRMIGSGIMKTGTRFTYHLSKRLCTHMISTSNQNEFAPV